MLFGVKSPQKYGPAELSEIVMDFRSPLEILAHLFFIARHGTSVTIGVAPRIAAIAVEIIRENGVRR